jgi:hypothetical protein
MTKCYPRRLSEDAIDKNKEELESWWVAILQAWTSNAPEELPVEAGINFISYLGGTSLVLR